MTSKNTEDPPHTHDYIRNQLVMECPRCQLLAKLVVRIWASEWYRQDNHFEDPTDDNILNMIQTTCGKTIQPELLPLIRQEINRQPDRSIRALITRLEIEKDARQGEE